MTFPKATQDEMIQRYQAGESAWSIARRLGTKITSVTRVLKRHGITIHPPAHGKLTESQRAEIVAKYGPVSLASLAREYGVSAESVRKVLIKAGVQPNSRGNKFREFTPEELTEMMDSWKAGQSQQELAQRFGTHQTVVSRLLRQQGLSSEQFKSKAERHGNWKGGRRLNPHGYWDVRLMPDHPFYPMVARSGYVLEHRLAMAEQLGRPLMPHETVHHINGDITDNRPENLQLRSGRHGRGMVYVCADCGSRNIKSMHITEA